MGRNGTDPAASRAGSVPEPDGTELLGTTIADRYHLECVLGRGGMGLVYRAAHLGLRRQVAVKILHPSLAASPDVRNRFDREAFAAGKIDHPNCINVMDSGKLSDGTRYLAMELLEGKSLADVLEQEGQVAPGRALHILAHLLRGLGHIHAAGLIHRDIKPENIFLIRQGADEDFAKILDFGIAKGIGKTDLDEGVKLTQAGMAFGTPIYMSPEQALGNPMDGRSDLYAAAVIAYEMLAGQPPFYSEDKLEVMSMHTAKPVPPMRQRLLKGGKPVPSSVERLIARGLTKKPGDRYASAEVFLSAVEAALETPDGGATEVIIDRPANTTGSHSLVGDDGEVAIGGEQAIANAIEDVLATPFPPLPTVPAAPPMPQPPIVPVMPNPRDAPPPRGGVGIGLPYTGPAGEPIFGLTPEQRLAQAGSRASTTSAIAPALEPDDSIYLTKPLAKRRRWPIYAAIAGVAVALGVIIAIATRSASDSDEPTAPTIDPDSVAGRALAEHRKGKFADALALLNANPSALASDGEMQLVLGHVLAAKFERRDAIETYGKALVLRPDLVGDAELATNLKSLTEDPDAGVVAAAYDLWVRTPDPQASERLIAAAVSDDLKRRHAVAPIVERHGLGARVEWWRADALDLQQEATCQQRKEAVAKLRARGDARAIPALEQAIKRTVKGAPKVRYNPCLINEAKNAISFLSGSK